MKIILSPGEDLQIEFADTDGQFTIAFDTVQFPRQIVVKETGGMDGNVIGIARAVLYRESFSDREAINVCGMCGRATCVCTYRVGV